MSVLFIVLPLAFVIAGAAVLAFAWAVKGGQFDDLDTPAIRAALDDDETPRTARVSPGNDERRPDGVQGASS